jgi:hypothetical protein
MTSKYYTGFKPTPIKRPDEYGDLLQMLMRQSKGGQGGNSNSTNFGQMKDIADMGKSLFGSSGGLDSLGGAPSNFVNSSGGVSTAMQSPAPVTDFATGATMNPIGGGQTSNTLGSMGGNSWYNGLFNGGGMGAMAAPAAALLGAQVAHNKGISNWGDTAKGQLLSNTVDYYQGSQDGKEHGFMSKILDPDGATGQLSKSATDFATLDFSNGLKGMEDGLKSLFKLKLF